MKASKHLLFPVTHSHSNGDSMVRPLSHIWLVREREGGETEREKGEEGRERAAEREEGRGGKRGERKRDRDRER